MLIASLVIFRLVFDSFLEYEKIKEDKFKKGKVNDNKFSTIISILYLITMDIFKTDFNL